MLSVSLGALGCEFKVGELFFFHVALTSTDWAQKVLPPFDFFHEFLFTGWSV